MTVNCQAASPLTCLDSGGDQPPGQGSWVYYTEAQGSEREQRKIPSKRATWELGKGRLEKSDIFPYTVLYWLKQSRAA